MALARERDPGLVFVNLVETDMTYGHRNDPEGFHRCLQEIDASIPDLLGALGPDDLLLLTSDHGCDPTTPSTDHSREYALLVAHVPGRGPAARHDGEFADVGASAAAWLGAQTGDGLPGSAIEPVRAVELIERKRDGGEHPPGELTWLIEGYVAGRVAPEQMSAWAMAVVWRGLIGRRDARADAGDGRFGRDDRPLRRSGARWSTSTRRAAWATRRRSHSRRSRPPWACRSPSSRAAVSRHTGGTLDKLESIPGFRVALSVAELIEQVARIGAAVAAQSDDLVPADRLLYALRDVTGTVPSPGLIAASVMSKKLAAGADAILLDVKVGEGAFMPDLESARELAVRMRDIGLRAGRPTVCELTAMDSPLGSAVGNALEVAESCELLAGGGPADFRELVRGIGRAHGRPLRPGRRPGERAPPRARRPSPRARGCAPSSSSWRPRAETRALAEEPWSVLEAAPVVLAVPAPRAGAVARCGALAIGRAAMRLGAGRERKEDPIDHAVGIVVHAKPGDEVSAGEALADVHARDRGRAEQAAAEVLAAYELVDGAVERPALLLETIG